MLEINLILERPAVAAACRLFGQAYDDAFYVYRAENRGLVLATALFEIGKTDVCVTGYEGPGDDPFLFDGILRAGLHYAEMQGIETGVLPEKFRQLHRALFIELNYPSEVSFNIVNFFGKYKNCSRL